MEIGQRRNSFRSQNKLCNMYLILISVINTEIYFILIFSEFLKAKILKWASCAKEAHEGGEGVPLLEGAGSAGLGGPLVAHLGPAHGVVAGWGCGFSPTPLTWQVGHPPCSYI